MLVVSVLSGGLLSLALPPLDLGPVAFVAVIPFLWAVRQASAGRAFWCGWVFGIAYLGIVSWWVTVAGLVAWFPLVLPFALFYGFFALLVPALWIPERPMRSALAIAAWWVVMEFLRGFFPLGGYTWGTLGTTQHDNPLLLPLASLTGVWGVSFVVLLANAALLGLVENVKTWPRALAPVGLAAILVVGPVTLPEPGVRDKHATPIDVAIVQGNTPERHLFDRFLEDRVVAENHARLHLTLEDDPPDLAIWPENAVDHDPKTDPDLRRLVQSSVDAVGVPTLIGAITDAPGGDFYNETDLYLPGRGVVQRYRKLHPVPYGEYVPFRNRLGFIKQLALIPRDMRPGTGPVLFEPWGFPAPVFAGVICFENAFGDLTRQAVKQRTVEGESPSFLVVSTNNSTFLRTPLSEQHVVWSQIRAAENGRWIVHAALSGISAIVDPRGKVVARTPLFEPRILRAAIPQIDTRTLYTRLGDWFPVWCGIGVAAAFLFAPARRRKRGAPEPLTLRRGLVVLPTYQERATIQDVVTRVLAADPRVDVLVVDDGSPDGTAEVVRELAAGERRVSLVERSGKQGLASAYLEGFRRGLEARYDVIVEMDADLSHQPEELPRLLEATADHDVVIGSRYVPGGGVTNWSRGRVLLSKGGNLYARTLLRLPLRDATSGFRTYRTTALARLLEEPVTSDGYGFQVELANRAWRRGYDVVEVPITFREREHGQSKISRRIIVEAMVKVAGWAWRQRFRPAP
ncbi:MAG: apolipoprotein N-acyltransferase [Actinobacteria bacterium]|nr:apolipoprotein N-acyltransferase [Actinomycetota bacterium]